MIETKIPVEFATDEFMIVGGKQIPKTRFNGRPTFLHGDAIIKLGYAGKHEAELYPRIAYADLAYFAPVLDSGQVTVDSVYSTRSQVTPWVAQKFLPHEPRWPKDKIPYVEDKWAELEEVLNRYGVYDVFLDPLPESEGGGVRTFNWAIIGDKPVCYDYAAY
jgi:hypothetical protein